MAETTYKKLIFAQRVAKSTWLALLFGIFFFRILIPFILICLFFLYRNIGKLKKRLQVNCVCEKCGHNLIEEKAKCKDCGYNKVAVDGRKLF